MQQNKYKKIIYNIIIFIILPFFTTVIIESLSNERFWGGLSKAINDPYIFLCNMLIIASLVSIGAFLGRFRMIWVGVVIFICISLATVNYLLLCNRTLPFTAFDFHLLNMLPFIVKRYIKPLLLAAICLTIVAAMLILVALFLRALSKPKEKHSKIFATIYIVLMFSLTIGNISFARSAGILDTKFPCLPQSFIKNGYTYSFLLTLNNGIERVDGYSSELIGSITSNFAKTDNKAIKKPNIIFVQMESFFDLNALNNVSFSQNPVPNFSNLAEEYPSGLFTVPVLGAGTANTEFEVVTGMRVLDFGAGEYPYMTVLKTNTCESIANNLKKHGYTSHFIHNYKGSFYGRNNVYKNLGYDYFYSLEYMTGYSLTETGWTKDDILLRYINESLDSTDDSDLITAISVQAHGGYETAAEYEKHITVTDCKDKSLLSQYEYYANQIYESDIFIGKLIESVSKRDEETILVIYGDHMPVLDITEENLNGRTEYQTDYIIWNNMGIDYNDENLYSYQIGSKILESINIRDGVLNSCHQTYKDDDKYYYYLQALEYDMLYGKGYALDTKEAFPVSNMFVNRRSLKINNVSKIQNTKNRYLIKGDGFTNKTFVKIKYRILPVDYIDENTLELKYNSELSNVRIVAWEKDTGDSNIYIFTESVQAAE